MPALNPIVKGRPRPPFLRALGRGDPPASVEVAGQTYARTVVFKHDFTAATALYTGPDGRRITCKFSRTQPLFLFPLAWAGRIVARHEAKMLTLLADLPVPALLGTVAIDGKPARNVLARRYVEGHPLSRDEAIDHAFFAKLRDTLTAIHARDIAYVDLHKRENIIVGDDGQPYLIDFQISFVLPRGVLGRPLRWLLRMLQAGDLHHLTKHMYQLRRDLLPAGTLNPSRSPPRMIRLWRRIATPYRSLRRSLLVMLSVRKGRGRSTSEYEPEDAVLRELTAEQTSRPMH